MANTRLGGAQHFTVQEAQNTTLGQVGSMFNDGTAAMTPPTDHVFIAITFITDTVFNSTNGLVAIDDTLYPNSQAGTIGIDADGDAVDSMTFAKGITIYGRWKQIILVTGSIIAYVG